MIVALAGLPCLVISGDEEHGFVVVVPDLPGCHAQGASFEQAVENAQLAIGRYRPMLQ